MKRLDFRLPRFKRISWTGESAQQIWEPRLDRIANAWVNVEWISCGLGDRSCALLMLPYDWSYGSAMPWENHGLSYLSLQSTPVNATRDDPAFSNASQVLFPDSIAVGRPEALENLKVAWESRDNDVIGALLGYPDCCRCFFHRICVEEQIIDTTWPMAVETGAESKDTTSISITSSFISNTLWRWMGVRAVPHLPCRFDCVGTIRLGEQLLAIGRSFGYSEEMDWIEEILSWPVEWSALHGIAEIKTPVMKVVTNTDVTPNKYAVQLKGQRYPREGATGLSFPYQEKSRARRAEFQRYQRGAKNQVNLQ